MPNRDLMLRILGDASSYERATNRASESSKQLEKHVSGLEAPVKRAHTALLGMAAGMLGAGGVVVGLESMIKAAKDAQESQGHLAVSMKDAGLSYDANKASIEALIKKQSELAGFQQTDLRESYTRLITATKDVSTANTDLALSSDIARGRHIDLASATQLVIKANEGMTGSLRRMGIDIKPVHDAMNALTDSHLRFTTAQKDAAKALDLAATKQSAIAELQKRYAGQAAEYGNSSAGAADKFKVSLNNLEITLGTALLPTLTSGLKELSKWINHLNDSGQAARYAKEGAAVLKGVIHDATPIVKDGAHAFQKFADALGGDKNAVEALAGAFAAYKLTSLFSGVGAAAGEKGAAGKVGLLTRNLKTLGAIGVVTVGVEVLIHRKQIDNIGNGFTDWLTKLQQGSVTNDLAKAEAGIANLIPGVHVDWRSLTKSLAGRGGVGGGSAGGGSGSSGATRNSVTTAAAPFSNVPYQWGGGHGAAPGPSFSSGHGRSGIGLDCSGYARAVLANMGISVSGSADSLLNAAKSHPAVNQLMPGDLVFYEGVHPGHVMVYIGNGQVIGETHTGASGPEVHSVNYMPASGTGRYTGVKGAPGGGGGGDLSKAGGIVVPAGTSAASIADILAQGKSKGKPHHHHLLSGSHLLSTATQIALADSSGTPGTADDLTALNRAKTELEGMPHSVAVANELGSITRRINAITAANTRAHLAAQSAEYKKHAAAATAELKGLDAAWKKHGDMLKRQAGEAKQIADRSFTEAEAEMFKQFDRLTSMGMKSLEGERTTLTPAEQKIKDLQDGRAKAGRAAALSSAQSSLDAAIASGDPAAIAQAQAALDQAQYDQQLADLQVQADAERTAKDAQYADKEQAYQDQRDLDKQKLQDWLTDQKTALDDGRETWDKFYADLKKKAADGGFDVGSAFWDAWNQAASDNTSSTGAGNQSSSGGGAGGFYQAIAAGLADGTISQGLANLLRSGHKMEIPGLADGGRVLRTGLAVVHEGETYSGVNGSMGGITINLEVHGVIGSDRRAIARELADELHLALARKQQANAGRFLPVQVSGR